MASHFITYAVGDRFVKPAENLCDSALKVGGFDTAKIYGPADLDPFFRRLNQKVLDLPFGAGYFIWKPYVILKRLSEIPDGDTLCYCDSLYLFLEDIQPLLQDWLTAPPHIAIPLNKPNEPCYKEGMWTKGDALLLMNAAPGDVDTCHAWAGFAAMRRSFPAFHFMSAWLTYCQDPRIVLDTPSILSREPVDFVTNRYDQSVASLLTKRWGLSLRYLPNGPLQNLRLPFAVSEKR